MADRDFERLFEHLGRLTQAVERVANALERKGNVDTAEASPAALGFWTQLRNELAYLCASVPGVRWPRTAPKGFDQVLQDYEPAAVLETVKAFAALCDAKDTERKWWGPGMFNEKRWPVVIEKTTKRKSYTVPEPMPNVQAPSVQAILDHVADCYPAALELREQRTETVMGRSITVTSMGPGRQYLQDCLEGAQERPGVTPSGLAVEYLLDVWAWAENGRQENPPRLRLPDVFEVDGKRRWPAWAERCAFEAIRREREAVQELRA
jgi:hypothetical protein